MLFATNVGWIQFEKKNGTVVTAIRSAVLRAPQRPTVPSGRPAAEHTADLHGAPRRPRHPDATAALHRNAGGPMTNPDQPRHHQQLFHRPVDEGDRVFRLDRRCSRPRAQVRASVYADLGLAPPPDGAPPPATLPHSDAVLPATSPRDTRRGAQQRRPRSKRCAPSARPSWTSSFWSRADGPGSFHALLPADVHQFHSAALPLP